MATTVEQRSSLPVVPGAIPASSCTKLAIAVNCTQLAAAVWYVAPPVTFPVVYIRKRSGCVVANLYTLAVCGQLMECTVQLSSHTINLLLHFLGSGNMGKYSALWFCIVPPFGRANTATIELNIFPYCPPSHAIIYIYFFIHQKRFWWIKE